VGMAEAGEGTVDSCRDEVEGVSVRDVKLVGNGIPTRWKVTGITALVNPIAHAVIVARSD
jgi:hypothetical protein